MAEKDCFEVALQGLEEAVERLESGQLSLEESLAWFEAGVKGAALCQKILKEVETKVELLLPKNGAMIVEKFEEE
jgi:exodeoxyribonuclease VII small subunit